MHLHALQMRKTHTLIAVMEPISTLIHFITYLLEFALVCRLYIEKIGTN